MVERIAACSARHRKTAVFGWFLLVAVIFVACHQLPARNLPQADAGQSGVAEQTLNRLGFTTPPHEYVLIQSRGSGGPGHTFSTDPAMRRAARQVVAALAALPHSARDIATPLGRGGAALVSADGRSALVTFTVPASTSQEDQAVAPALRAVAGVAARHTGLLIAEAGDASTDRAGNAIVSQDFRQAEETSVPITLILLTGVFGALIAAGIPVLLAGTAVFTALALLAIPGQWLPIDSSTSEVVLLIGMAVGVDYSLFYLRREREERARGAGTEQALRTAAATSGRAILVSGLTVMIALGGLFLTGYSEFTGIAFGTIAVVGVAVLGSLTFLPALLSWLGPWADRGRVPFLGRRRTAARPSRLWTALVRRVIRHPAAWGSVAALAMLALAAPALGLRLGNPPNGGFPTKIPIVATYDRINRAFPGGPAPAEVVVTGHDLAGPQVTRALGRLRAEASANGPIRGPVRAAAVARGRAVLVSVPLAGDGTDAVSNRALLDLRNHVLPGTLGRVRGVSYAVTGNTAQNYDDTGVLRGRTPVVLAVVAGLAFLLLLIAFRSALIPLVSISLNLLSVAAAFGLLTVIFQAGQLGGPLGFTSYGAIVPWVPLFVFVFLFGLSMDYHVFILSRIRELRGRGATTTEAVVGGIASSAGVVTSAALIMMAVFSIFATLALVQLKMLGVTLTAAVLIDATVVRGILLPACLALLGERSWYLPRWLHWLPGRPVVPFGPAGPAATAPVPGQAGPAGTAGSAPTFR
ncbi:MAG TPA: MMPL family transporter [Streptosporangiaceae bacterium]|nr:MMPL family transporter [Streptosporangiaceae bacterium]